MRPSQRAVYLKKALNAPSNGMSAILISNTGPLLSSFEDVVRTDCEAEGQDYESIRLEVQTELLNQLDSNEGGERTIGGYTFSMINIARIDNISFAGEFLARILNDSLWLPCQTCEKRGKCPICHNHELLKNNTDRVKAFILDHAKLYRKAKVCVAPVLQVLTIHWLIHQVGQCMKDIAPLGRSILFVRQIIVADKARQPLQQIGVFHIHAFTQRRRLEIIYATFAGEGEQSHILSIFEMGHYLSLLFAGWDARLLTDALLRSGIAVACQLQDRTDVLCLWLEYLHPHP